MACLHEETRIKMADLSETMIRDIETGDYVYDESGISGIVEVDYNLSGHEESIWYVKAEGAEVVQATGKHPFMTQNGMKPVNRLNLADKLLLENGTYSAIEVLLEKKENIFVHNLGLHGKKMYANGYCVGDYETQCEVEAQAGNTQDEKNIAQEQKIEMQKKYELSKSRDELFDKKFENERKYHNLLSCYSNLLRQSEDMEKKYRNNLNEDPQKAFMEYCIEMDKLEAEKGELDREWNRLRDELRNIVTRF